MSDNISVLYVTLQSTNPGQAAHAHVHQIVQGLSRRGVNVRLSEVSYSQDPNIVRRLAAMCIVTVGVVRRIRSLDLVYVRWHFFTFFAVLISKVARRKVVVEVNGNFDDVFVSWPALRRVRWLIEWLMRRQLRMADHNIAVTTNLTQWVAALAPGVPASTVSNGADVDLFTPKSGVPAAAECPNYVVFFGALSRWQGIQTIIDATDHVDWPARLQLVVIGEGIEERTVRSAAERSSRIRYLGGLGYEEVPPWVAGASASLIVKEGDFSTGLMPLKLFESAACAVPVVVSDYPGIADVVRSEQMGVVVPPCDPGAVARAVRELAADENARVAMGLRARRWVVAGHSWDARSESTFQLVKRVVG